MFSTSTACCAARSIVMNIWDFEIQVFGIGSWGSTENKPNVKACLQVEDPSSYKHLSRKYDRLRAQMSVTYHAACIRSLSGRRLKWCFSIWPELEVWCSMGKDSVIAGFLLHSCSERLVQLFLLQMPSLAMAALLLAACILPRANKNC